MCRCFRGLTGGGSGLIRGVFSLRYLDFIGYRVWYGGVLGRFC